MRKLLPTTLGLYLAALGAAHGQEGPVAAPPEPAQVALNSGTVNQSSANQQLANTISERLRSNANLKNYRVGVSVTDGVVELNGQVVDQAQCDEVMRTVQAVPGVDRVRDNMMVLGGRTVLPAQAIGPQFNLARGGGGNGMPPEPLPIFTAQPGGMPNPQMQPPPLPPNAWPTYAPYNNYSRVAYPKQYPYESWPFVGPMYPFPKVPLGWRAVTLRWQDGYWWYGREACGHDWWRVRYW